jgi:hypothetical protein
VPGLCLTWLPQSLLVLSTLTGITLPTVLVALAAVSSEVGFWHFTFLTLKCKGIISASLRHNFMLSDLLPNNSTCMNKMFSKCFLIKYLRMPTDVMYCQRKQLFFYNNILHAWHWHGLKMTFSPVLPQQADHLHSVS